MIKILVSVIAIVSVVAATVALAESPQRVSIAPSNDLSAIMVPRIPGTGIGPSVDGYNLSKEYEEGHRLGVWNNHYGRRNKLVIDDGRTAFPAKDEKTGFPLIVLTNAKITRELQDLVRGYNAAMQWAFEAREKAK